MAKGTKAAARVIIAEYQLIIREQGRRIPETFNTPEGIERNHVFISVAALNALERAVRGEDTLAAMKRNQNGGA